MKNSIPAWFRRLIDEHASPCISIYMPTQRARPPAVENPVRLRNLIREAEQSLGRRYARREYGPLIERLQGLLRDGAIWAHPTDGLAIFCCAGILEVVKLQRGPAELAVVSDTFHLKPLMRAQQLASRFQVLCLSQRRVAMCEGDMGGLEEIALGQVPAGIYDALQMHPTNGDEAGIHRISGGEDLLRFFRIVDKAVRDHHSRPTGLPLILCAVEAHHEPFRRISRNEFLVEEGIRHDPEGLSIERLGLEAKGIMEPYYRREVEKVLEEYGRARSQARGSEDIEEVAEAAARSRVGTLLVDADKHVGGRITAGGRVELGDSDGPDFNDVLDDIAERVMKAGGQVLVMPRDQMPTETGVAAIYRF